MIKKFNFYKNYADVIGDMSNKDAGKFIRLLLDFMIKDIEPKVSEKNMIGSMFLLMLNELREDKERIRDNKETIDRNERRFTFYSEYSNIFYTLTEEKAGALIKRVCEYMFNEHYIDPNDYEGTIGVFGILKRQLRKSKVKSQNAKTPKITLEKIYNDFPNIMYQLKEDNDILRDIDLKELYEFIKSDTKYQSTAMYGIVKTFRDIKGLDNYDKPTTKTES